jgi:hypothetical protein
VVLLFAYISCGKKLDKIEDSVYAIKIDTEQLQSMNCEKFDSCTYIVLETTDASLIGSLDKLYITYSLIIIFDVMQMNIIVFNLQGKYIRHIGKKGIGPNEYLYFNDIHYNAVSKQIYAHERYLNKMFIYDLYGNCIHKSEKLKYSFDSFYKTEEGYWIYSCYRNNNPNCYNLMLLDEEMQEMKAGFFPQKTFFFGISTSTFTCDENGTPYFFYPSSNIVYKLSGDNVFPYFMIDFGNRMMPYDKIIELTDVEEYTNIISDKKYLGDISNFKVNKDNIFFDFKESGFNTVVNYYHCLFNTNTMETFIYSNPFFDKCKYPIMTGIKQIVDNKFVFVLEPSVFSENSFSILSKELSSYIDGESNPVLCLFELKNK